MMQWAKENNEIKITHYEKELMARKSDPVLPVVVVGNVERSNKPMCVFT